MPDPGYDDLHENQIKHFELVQAVVARLSGNGFLVKGWAITVTGAIAGFAVAQASAWLALTGLVPILLFWFLDASFLRAERAFRVHGDRVVSGELAPFDMNAIAPETIRELRPDDRGTLGWPKVVTRPSVLWFYMAMLAFVSIVAGAATTLGDDEELNCQHRPLRGEHPAHVRSDRVDIRCR